MTLLHCFTLSERDTMLTCLQSPLLARMPGVQLSVRSPIIMTSVSLSTSPVTCKRMGKRIRNAPEWKRIKLSKGPWWKTDQTVMTSPLARTQHPVSAFTKLEEDLNTTIAQQSVKDSPVEMEDPYAPAPTRCILCPDRYEPGHAPTPSYLNPKLLSQFTSPHTGKVYEKHITGLCSKMQAVVEKEALRSIAAGLMSSRVKSPDYLQDPQICNASRPHMPNPY